MLDFLTKILLKEKFKKFTKILDKCSSKFSSFKPNLMQNGRHLEIA